jgi:UDP-3-O-[3-hydroxymyristoyl] glucosamine N-acyltransferase
MSLTLGELAVRFGCELRGDPGLRVDRVATLDAAAAGALCFLANPRYRRQLAQTRATAVVLAPAEADACPVAALLSANPYATYAHMASLLHPTVPPSAGVHASAVLASGAQVDATAQVCAGVVIGEGASIGPRCYVGPGSVLGAGVQLGADSRLQARVTLEHDVIVGVRALIHAGAVLGADGFGFARDGEGWTKVPQFGGLRIGDDVEIGANTTIDRGAIEDTVIEDGVKIDNQVQIGHNVRIGAHTVIAACVGISGSTRIGRRCMIGGATGIVGHLEICDDVALTGMSMVAHSISRPGIYSGGIPAEPARDWRRIAARLKRLDSYARRLARLERGRGVAGNELGIEDADDD